jgi:hypothetical protein
MIAWGDPGSYRGVACDRDTPFVGGVTLAALFAESGSTQGGHPPADHETS